MIKNLQHQSAYGKIQQGKPTSWTDHLGKVWKPINSVRQLQFKISTHAAMRAFVFHRDNFCCLRCGARAIDVPDLYCGRYSLETDTFLKDGCRDVLILDHILTRKAGGLNHPINLQALCDTCNKRKIPEDLRATSEFLRGAPS
jgi:5-methylcytosine-specific restriction endonuclease McrA